MSTQNYSASIFFRLPNGRGIVKERCKLPRNLLPSLVGEGGCQVNLTQVRNVFKLSSCRCRGWQIWQV